jgi:hypothetical protein
LRRVVQDLTRRGVRIEFVKEGLTFTGEDSRVIQFIAWTGGPHSISLR